MAQMTLNYTSFVRPVGLVQPARVMSTRRDTQFVICEVVYSQLPFNLTVDVCKSVMMFQTCPLFELRFETVQNFNNFNQWHKGLRPPRSSKTSFH